MWKISKINNETHKVTLVNDKGSRIHLCIPKEHRVSKQHKHAYIEAVSNRHDRKHAKISIIKRILFIAISISLLIFKLKSI